ncbi:MAG: TetR family transcriptional regulator [Mycobacterium sp.]
MVHTDRPDDRRLTAKGRATRDRIVKAAAELILSDGLSALNMEALRKAASVSGSQLTHYFTDKQELLRAVVTHQIQVVLDFHRQPPLRALDTFDDFERWIDLNLRYLRRIGYSGTPTYHALTGQLAKSDNATRETLAAGYRQWVDLLERAIQRMKEHGVLLKSAEPQRLALLIVTAHQGGATLSFTYQREWPHADAVRFGVNYLRMFAADPAERVPRPPRRSHGRRTTAVSDDAMPRLTGKGRATRDSIVDAAAQLMFQHGVGGTSVDDVRRTATVSGSQISHYFDDRRDLIRHVIAARRNDVQHFHTQPRLGALDSLDALGSWVEANMADVDSVYRKGGCIYGSLAGELTEGDPDIHADLAAGYDDWLNLLRAGLTSMRRRGELRPDADPRHLAVSLVVAHQGGALVTHATNDAEPLHIALDAAVKYVRSFAPAANARRRRGR